MENILTVPNLIALLMGTLGAAVAAIFVVHSGLLFMSAQGDPQRMAQARNSIIGVAVGVIIIGGAFIIPGTISRFIIEPAGGVRVEPRAGVDCDGLLKSQLVIQRTASTPERMQYVISRLQGQRDECAPELWNPVVKKGAGFPRGCPEPVGEIGSVAVPDGLKEGASVKNRSSRDDDNNVLVYWAHPDAAESPPGLPSDGSVCWLYLSAFDSWTENYRSP